MPTGDPENFRFLYPNSYHRCPYYPELCSYEYHDNFTPAEPEVNVELVSDLSVELHNLKQWLCGYFECPTNQQAQGYLITLLADFSGEPFEKWAALVRNLSYGRS